MIKHAIGSVFWATLVAAGVILNDGTVFMWLAAALVFFYVAASNFVSDVQGDTIKLLEAQLEFAHERIEGLQNTVHALQGVIDDISEDGR